MKLTHVIMDTNIQKKVIIFFPIQNDIKIIAIIQTYIILYTNIFFYNLFYLLFYKMNDITKKKPYPTDENF